MASILFLVPLKNKLMALIIISLSPIYSLLALFITFMSLIMFFMALLYHFHPMHCTSVPPYSALSPCSILLLSNRTCSIASLRMRQRTTGLWASAVSLSDFAHLKWFAANLAEKPFTRDRRPFATPLRSARTRHRGTRGRGGGAQRCWWYNALPARCRRLRERAGSPFY